MRQTSTVTEAIAAIAEHVWTDIDYADGGQAQVAETTLGPDRLVVRRTRLTRPQTTLWPDWRYHAFVTGRQGSAIELDADHRRHAVCELAIRDLKDGAGLRHGPSGKFLANAAWLVITALAHNLLRWTSQLGPGHPGPGGGQDAAAAPAHLAWAADPPGTALAAAPADQLAMGQRLRHAITRLRALPAAT